MRTLPAADYHDPDVHQTERRAVFGREWQFVSHAEALRTDESYVATTVAGWPIVVVRDAGALRGFHNVCRHRAGPLLDDGVGSTRSFVCRYHGWSYALDGSLRSARDSGIPDDAQQSLCLFEVRVEQWRNLVFVCLDHDAGADRAPDLVTWLGEPFIERCAPFPIESWTMCERIEHTIACNWKTYGDNYLEGYHIPFVHPDLARAIDTTSYRVDAHDWWAQHHADARPGAEATGVWLWHWPNLAFNLYEHGASIERWEPIDATTSRLTLDFLFDDISDEGMARNRADIDASAQICSEDKRICEAVQRNLEAGVYQCGELSPRHEAGVEAFQTRVIAARASGSYPSTAR